MSRRVSSLFRGRIGGGLMMACLLTLAAFFGGASSASAAATGKIATVYWQNGSASGYELQVTVTTTAVAEIVKVSGSGIPVTDLYATLEGDGLVFQGTAVFTPPLGTTAPVVGTPYTIDVNYGSGGAAAEKVTAQITGVLGSANTPGLTAPMGAVASTSSPTFYWTAPAVPPAGFSKYKVVVSGPESFYWNTEVLSPATSTVYNGPSLVTGTRYDWAAAAMDSNGNRAENRNFFVLGANFSGRVTDLNGNPLQGIEVQAATPAGVDVGAPVITGADGTYIYAGLPPGQYKIHFDFQTYYWKNRLDSASADVLTVTAGAVTSNVNATLRGWGAIAGSVYFPGYKPAAGAEITLLNLNKAAVASVPAVAVPLTASGFGNYYMALIPPGTYYLRYSAPGYTPVDKQVVVSQNTTLQGVPEVTNVFNNPIVSALTVAISGTGTVTSAPVGISCTNGITAGCSSSFTAGTVVTLTATPKLGSVFAGWSGACTGANCVVTVDAAKSVTATFTAQPATVLIVGDTTPYYSIDKAVVALPNVTTLQRIRAKAQTFVENVLMAKPGVQVVLEGGYTDLANTATRTGRTTIDGSLKIRSGKLIPERLVIK